MVFGILSVIFHSSDVSFHCYSRMNCIRLYTRRNEWLYKDTLRTQMQGELLRSKRQWGWLSSSWIPEDWLPFQVSRKDWQLRGTQLRWRESVTHLVELDFNQSMPESSPVVSITRNCKFLISNRQAQQPPGLTCANQAHRRVSKMEPPQRLGPLNEPSLG